MQRVLSLLPFLVVWLLLSVAALPAYASEDFAPADQADEITPTGLRPVYPADQACSPLTSLYASWSDVDGSQRDRQHTGVDGGRLNEWIVSPAPGRVRAVWRSNWGWGWEGSLILVHTRRDVGLKKGPPLYYSVLDHLNYEEIKDLQVGQRIERGQRLARVQHPGGNPDYLPEVHWEVWEVDADQLQWQSNSHGGEVWSNPAARLIDPLTMMRLASSPLTETDVVRIVPAADCLAQKTCRGFTYILPCKKKAAKSSAS